jgi:hypothetical protein
MVVDSTTNHLVAAGEPGTNHASTVGVCGVRPARKTDIPPHFTAVHMSAVVVPATDHAAMVDGTTVEGTTTEAWAGPVDDEPCATSTFEEIHDSLGRARLEMDRASPSAHTMQPIVVHHEPVVDVQPGAIVRVGPEGVAASSCNVDGTCELGDVIVTERIIEPMPVPTGRAVADAIDGH